MDHQEFLRAISDAPACDATRLAYADWLEDHGEPHEARYLRTELELFALPLDSADAPAIRARLWQAWAEVDPAWLRRMTQPRILRANPTPYPSGWMGIALGNRKTEADAWPYESLPAIELPETADDFGYLRPPRQRAIVPEDEEVRAEFRAQLDELLQEAAERSLRLPQAFVKFMKRHGAGELEFGFAGCELTVGAIWADSAGEGSLVTFAYDEEDFRGWQLLIHDTGGHCVLGSDREKTWFVAPSFETFIYRRWLEDEVWRLERLECLEYHGKTSQSVLMPAVRAYRDAYRDGWIVTD